MPRQPPWEVLYPQPCALWLSPSVNRYGPSTSNKSFPIITYLSNIFDTSTIASFLETLVSSNFPPYEVLLDEGFYGKPIILETEPDQEFLGFMLETQPLELIYTGPTNISQVLSPYSASPPKVLLSGFRSRCHIVVKGAFPEFRVQQGLDQLIHLYTLAGFPNEELQMISTQILTQHLNFQPHENRASLSRWFFTFCGFPFCCFTCYFLFFTTYFDVSLAQTRTPIHLRFKINFQWNNTPWNTPMAVKSTTIWLGLLCI